jgi:hypothetical protein
MLRKNSFFHLLVRAPGAAFGLIFALALSDRVQAHGFVGDYFFPATLTIEDPFVADDLSLPTFSTIIEPGEGEETATRTVELSAEFSKRIAKDWQLSVEAGYVFPRPAGQSFVSGFENVAVSTKYQFLGMPSIADQIGGFEGKLENRRQKYRRRLFQHHYAKVAPIPPSWCVPPQARQIQGGLWRAVSVDTHRTKGEFTFEVVAGKEAANHCPGGSIRFVHAAPGHANVLQVDCAPCLLANGRLRHYKAVP